MKALITGITGMAGSHLADYLIDQEGIEVHGIKRYRSRIDHIRYDVNYHTGDINDLSALLDIFTKVKPDFIFHLAAQSQVAESFTDPWSTLQTNIGGTCNILEAARRACPQTTIHFAGSSEEYGMVNPDECPVSELQPLYPRSPYAVSKIAGEYLCHQYFHSYNLKIITTRAFNHTGPRRNENFVTSKIARQLALIMLGKAEPILTLGNLNAVRDFTDVRDTVRAYWLAVNRCQPGIPYNIGTGVGHSITAVLNTLMLISEVLVEIKQDPQFIRPSDVPLLICDSTAFRNATGWKPEIPFEQTMRALFYYWMERLR